MPLPHIRIWQEPGHPPRWKGEIEAQDAHGATRNRTGLEGSTYKEVHDQIEAAHHELAPLDPPLLPLDAVIDRLEGGIEAEGEKIHELVSSAGALRGGSPDRPDPVSVEPVPGPAQESSTGGKPAGDVVAAVLPDASPPPLLDQVAKREYGEERFGTRHDHHRRRPHH